MNKDYYNMLIDSAKKTGSIVCMGLDPIAEAIPIEGGFRKKVTLFYEGAFNRLKSEGKSPGAFKPNQGFFEIHDNPETGHYEGSETLAETIFLIRESFPQVPIILDYKRGDIATSSGNYAQVALNWKVDALTVSPYMGSDSVMPFIQTGKGVYILDRTSNKGGADFQNLTVIKDPDFRKNINDLIVGMIGEGKSNAEMNNYIQSKILPYIDSNASQLYEVVSQKIAEWGHDYKGVGAVFGATNPDELRKEASFFSFHEIPLLIPGVGKQGGSAKDVVSILDKSEYDLNIARINSSTAITHPWKTMDKAPKEWDVEVLKNFNSLNDEINNQRFQGS